MPNSSKEFINYLICTKCGMATVDQVYEINSDSLFTHDRFLYLKCPECGAKVTDWFTRIVGFFVRVSDFNKVRREWEFPRRKPNIIQ